MRSSKDLAKRLRFDLIPRPSAFRRLYFALGLGACVGAVALWYVFTAMWSERQYLPGPVSPAHATFGGACRHCHTSAYAAVPDGACGECHTPAIHSELALQAPACRDCHLEHRGAAAIESAGDSACVDCHADLQTRGPSSIAAHVRNFDSHPPFVPSRQGFEDRAALRFNHQIHLGSAKIPPDRKLVCASCHVAEADGKLMRPVTFSANCRDCHRQAGLGPLGDIEALHAAPDKVRRDLSGQLLAEAVSDPGRLFGQADFFLPGRNRGAVDQSKSLAEFDKKWVDTIEAQLYAPFDPAAPLEQHNRYCFLCHIEGDAKPDDGLPAIQATAIPQRWLKRARFSHASHALVACEQCHSAVRESRATSDASLPGKAICQRCHLDGSEASAGSECVLCHVYHGEGAHLPAAGDARRLSIDVLTGGPPNPP